MTSHERSRRRLLAQMSATIAAGFVSGLAIGPGKDLALCRASIAAGSVEIAEDILAAITRPAEAAR